MKNFAKFSTRDVSLKHVQKFLVRFLLWGFLGLGTIGGIAYVVDLFSNSQPLTIVYSTTANEDEISQSRYDAVRLALYEKNYLVGKHEISLKLMSNSAGLGSLGVWDAELEKRNAQRTAEDMSVVAYIGPADSGAAQVSMPVLNKADIVQISLTNTYPGLTQSGFAEGEPEKYYPTGDRHYYRLVADDTYQSEVSINFLQENNKHSLYVIEDMSLYEISHEYLTEEHAEKFGVTIKGHQNLSDADVVLDANMLAEKIIASGADSLLFTGYTTEILVRILHALNEQGFMGIVIGGDALYNEKFATAIADITAFPIYCTYLTNTITENNGNVARDFLKLYRETYRREPRPGDASAYDATRLILHAIEISNGERRDILEKFRTIKDYPGAIGFVNFDKNGDLIRKNSQIIKIENGGFTFIKDVIAN